MTGFSGNFGTPPNREPLVATKSKLSLSTLLNLFISFCQLWSVR